MALAHCNLGKFLGVGCHCFPPPLDVPAFSTRCLHVQRRERPLAAEGGTLRGREMFRQISSRNRLPLNCRDLLHAANLRQGTDGFTSPPKEGVLRIFSPLKIRRLRQGLNPRTWVPKANTLPLDHRSRSYTYIHVYIYIYIYINEEAQFPFRIKLNKWSQVKDLLQIFYFSPINIILKAIISPLF